MGEETFFSNHHSLQERSSIIRVWNSERSLPTGIQLLRTRQTSPLIMSLDFETVVEQEVKRLQVIHPTPEEIPGCIKLLDDFLSCHGASISLLVTGRKLTVLSTRHATEILVQVWWDITVWEKARRLQVLHESEVDGPGGEA